MELVAGSAGSKVRVAVVACDVSLGIIYSFWYFAWLGTLVDCVVLESLLGGGYCISSS